MEKDVPPIGKYDQKKPDIQPYDPACVLVADEVIGLILDRLPFVWVEHVGSTAVPGLAGKGIIDLMVVFPTDKLDEVKEGLAGLGFQPQPHDDPFPEDRPMRVGSFVYGGRSYLLHVHVIREGSLEIEDMRTFRDRLRYDRVLQTAYVDRKKQILKTGIKNSSEYARLKGEFIDKILKSGR